MQPHAAGAGSFAKRFTPGGQSTILLTLSLVCLQALAAEKAAAAHERELEVARLRALQEKVLDTRSQEDELRAKRYQVGAANCAGTAQNHPARCRKQHANSWACLQDSPHRVHAVPNCSQEHKGA